MYQKIMSTILVSILIGGCSSAGIKSVGNESSSITITNFKDGLIEFDENNKPRIYQEGDTFPYKENGKCVAANQEHSCQWRGFEFDYESPYEITKFDCVAISNRKQDYAYPDRYVGKNSKSSKWGFIVKGKSGHYIRPQYSFGITDKPLHITFMCSHEGIEVLNWKISLLPQG